MIIFLDPHGDDVPLFAAFSLLAEANSFEGRVLPIVVFDSYVQPSRGYPHCEAGRRREETLGAYRQLLRLPDFCGLRDDVDYIASGRVNEVSEAISKAIQRQDDRPISAIYAPLWEHNGHVQHNLVANAVYSIAPNVPVRRYTTYTRTNGRSRSGNVVRPTANMIACKHQALSYFWSQMQEVTGCQEWFLGDLKEYLA